MNVFIESTLNGIPTSHLELTTTPNSTVDSLISAFCINKGIRQRPQYILKTQQNVLLDNTKTLESCGILSGDVLYLTTKNEDQHLFGFHNWWLLAGVALFIGLIGTITVSILYGLSGGIPSSYGIVFDAGSSHTAMAVYQWDGEKQNGTGQVSQLYYCEVNGSGISSYAQTPEKAGKSLEHCLDEAKRHVPADRHQTSHVYLGATAGMRLLNISNPKIASAVMASVNQTLALSGFDYSKGQARILTGQQEGIFGWITINYLSFRLGRPFQGNTLGALDMGGASTQISFVPKPDSSREYKGNCYVNLRLYGQDYRVFSRSFLCFGMNEFERRFHFELASESENDTEAIQNPCSQIGFNYTVTKDAIFNHPCTSNVKGDSTNITFVGKYNASECESKIRTLLNAEDCTQKFRYCLNGTSIPERSGDFMAFSGFPYLLNDLNLTRVLSLAEMRNKIEAFCNLSAEEVERFHVPASADEFLSQICFRTKYILLLLTDVYKFDTEEQWERLSFVRTIRKVNVGWSLGFMTNATNLIPEESPIVMIELPIFVLLVVLFTIFIVTALTFGYCAWKQKKRSSSYQRFSQYGAI